MEKGKQAILNEGAEQLKWKKEKRAEHLKWKKEKRQL
jgi:hypothetical protein